MTDETNKCRRRQVKMSVRNREIKNEHIGQRDIQTERLTYIETYRQREQSDIRTERENSQIYVQRERDIQSYRQRDRETEGRIKIDMKSFLCGLDWVTVGVVLLKIESKNEKQKLNLSNRKPVPKQRRKKKWSHSLARFSSDILLFGWSERRLNRLLRKS
jgi:hypothetical protein